MTMQLKFPSKPNFKVTELKAICEEIILTNLNSLNAFELSNVGSARYRRLDGVRFNKVNSSKYLDQFSAGLSEHIRAFSIAYLGI